MQTQPTIYKGRRAREHERHRLEILDAAERIFAAKGYDATTVEEIAREAEFAVGTLYKFFDGKETLFLAVADRILDDFLERFDNEVIPFLDEPKLAVERYVAIRMAEVLEHEAFLHVLQPVCRDRRDKDEREGKASRRHTKISAFRERVIAMFEEGVRKGVLQPVPAADLMVIVEGSVRFFAKTWMHSSQTLPSPEEQQQILERSLLTILWANENKGVSN